MSDGGAGALVKVFELLTRSRGGHVILALWTFFMLQQWVVAWWHDKQKAGPLLLFALVLALCLVIGLVRSWWRRRSQAASQRMGRRIMVLFGAVVLFFVMAVAGVIVLLRWRRRNVHSELETLDPDEIDRLALQELEEEQA